MLRRLRRALLARRRPLAALCAALATAAALQANAAPPTARVLVLTAAHDLPPGATIGPDDLTSAGFAPDKVPRGALRTARAAVGRRTIGPVRAGEPLTDVRLLDDAFLARHPGTVAAPVRIGDAAVVDLLRVGDLVTILATDPQGDAEARVVAERVPVIAVPQPRQADVGLASGALILVAAPDATATALAGAGVTSFLSVVLVR